MKFVFDHLVHFVEEPKEVVDTFTKHGLHTAEGGKHINRGTYNVLSYFDLSYIEFISTYDRELVKKLDHMKHSLLETIINDNFAEGFARFVVRTHDIEAAAEHFRNKGLSVSGPTPLRRQRPDGDVLEWQLLYVGDDSDELQLPFIIQWNETDEERREDLTKRNVIAPHPAGVTFSHLTFAVNDASHTANKWADLLNLEKGDTYVDDALNATCAVLHLEGGNLIFASPNGDGKVADVLKERGEKPFQVNFSGGEKDTSFDLLGGTFSIEAK